jgi:hypothetical protein
MHAQGTLEPSGALVLQALDAATGLEHAMPVLDTPA